MLRDGPFPAFLHGLVEYIAGALFIALPLLLDYESGAATAASILIGVGLITVAATTDWGFSLVNKIPKPAHLVLDYGVAALLIASPFIFGFSDESVPTAIFIAAGVLHVLLTIGTRFVKDDAPASRKRQREAAPPMAETQAQAPAGSRQRFERQPDSSEGRITTAVSEEQQAAQQASGQTGDRATARRES
jgi:hypothetical protein